MWIDTHCHLDAPEFAPDRAAVAARARAAGVGGIVIPAVARRSWSDTRDTAHALGCAYALGIHPLYTPEAEEGDLAALAEALNRWQGDARLVAVGEIGLDGFVPAVAIGAAWDKQQHFYRAQLKLAQQAGLPVILHVRRSADALLHGLRRQPVAGGIAHAFNGSAQQAQAFVGLGFRLGFGGALAYERALQLQRLARSLPPSALVLETDAPDIPPPWLYRNAAERAAGAPQGRNEPGELPRIAQTLAALRGWSLEETAATTRINAHAALPRLAAALAPPP